MLKNYQEKFDEYLQSISLENLQKSWNIESETISRLKEMILKEQSNHNSIAILEYFNYVAFFIETIYPLHSAISKCNSYYLFNDYVLPKLDNIEYCSSSDVYEALKAIDASSAIQIMQVCIKNCPSAYPLLEYLEQSQEKKFVETFNNIPNAHYWSKFVSHHYSVISYEAQLKQRLRSVLKPFAITPQTKENVMEVVRSAGDFMTYVGDAEGQRLEMPNEPHEWIECFQGCFKDGYCEFLELKDIITKEEVDAFEKIIFQPKFKKIVNSLVEVVEEYLSKKYIDSAFNKECVSNPHEIGECLHDLLVRHRDEPTQTLYLLLRVLDAAGIIHIKDCTDAALRSYMAEYMHYEKERSSWTKARKRINQLTQEEQQEFNKVVQIYRNKYECFMKQCQSDKMDT